MRTLVGCPEPNRPRNEPIAWTTGTTTNTTVTAGWVRLDVKR